MECKCSAECKPANEILEALDLLHRTYPEDRAEIWCGINSKGVYYHVMLGEEETVWVHSATNPMQAAMQAIEKAGPRSKSARLAKRIATLKAEIAELEGK